MYMYMCVYVYIEICISQALQPDLHTELNTSSCLGSDKAPYNGCFLGSAQVQSPDEAVAGPYSMLETWRSRELKTGL